MVNVQWNPPWSSHIKLLPPAASARFPSPPPSVVRRPSYLRRRASRSDSSSTRMSLSRTAKRKVSGVAFWGEKRGTFTWSLYVADNGPRLILEELNSHLRHATSRSCSQLACCVLRKQTLESSVPVRPRTRTTFTSLTGTLEESMAQSSSPTASGERSW